jgi:sulfur relay (sulfurtransferase) DsrC/TusE family protein
MANDFEGQSIETTATGYLRNPDDWSQSLGERVAQPPESRRKGWH